MPVGHGVPDVFRVSSGGLVRVIAFRVSQQPSALAYTPVECSLEHSLKIAPRDIGINLLGRGSRSCCSPGLCKTPGSLTLIPVHTSIRLSSSDWMRASVEVREAETLFRSHVHVHRPHPYIIQESILAARLSSSSRIIVRVNCDK